MPRAERDHAVLGIDTSNYKTSVALVSQEGDIICNLQRFLDVKKGERGLRQSVALFQHVNRLPEMIEQAFAALPPGTILDGVAVSSRPRPVEGSYMPVFLAGLSAARTIATARSLPLMTFSHQEGHVAAVRFRSPLEDTERFLSFHFSGGTSECLLADGDSLNIVGGSKDLAFGQVLDRVGVAMGFEFPCGQEIDRLAMEETAKREALKEIGSSAAGRVKGSLLPKIKCEDGYINLSGIETKCQRLLQKTTREKTPEKTPEKAGEPPAETGVLSFGQLSAMLMDRICQAMADQTAQLAEKYDVSDALFAGGVSSSQYIRRFLPERLAGIRCCFGEPSLSCDNAVGIALLGGRELWR